MSRSVRDSARFLDVVAGAVAGSKYALPPSPRSFMEATVTDPGVLRIAVVTTDFEGDPVHPDCVAAVTETADLLEELGHSVEERTADFDSAAGERRSSARLDPTADRIDSPRERG